MYVYIYVCMQMYVFEIIFIGVRMYIYRDIKVKTYKRYTCVGAMYMDVCVYVYL